MKENQIQIKLQNKTYYCKQPPTIGNIMDIESNKQLFSNNRYGAMARTGGKSSNIALDLIDAAATMMVLFPEIQEDIKITSILDMSPMDAKEFVKEYKSKVQMWYIDWLSMLEPSEESAEQKQQEEEEAAEMSE